MGSLKRVANRNFLDYWRRNKPILTAPPKLPRRRAIRLAQDYCSLMNKEMRTPTQLGFERHAKEMGVRGNRDLLREIFQEVVGPLKRGPPAKQA
jgi:hypothetical protein